MTDVIPETEIKTETSQETIRTPDYQKLIDAGCKENVAAALDAIFQDGKQLPEFCCVKEFNFCN